MSTKLNLPGGQETILIVDDHETIWDFLIEALQELGYSVLLAENGLDAVEIYRENPAAVDLVLLDMIMPKCGGHQAFHKSAKWNPSRKFCFPAAMFSEERYTIDASGALVFSKPHRITTVAQAIRESLDPAESFAATEEARDPMLAKG